MKGIFIVKSVKNSKSGPSTEPCETPHNNNIAEQTVHH